MTNRNTNQKAKSNRAYTSDDIQVLEGMEAVRKRPGMYIGSTDQRGLHHLIYEIVDNSVDEFMAGYCSSVDVVIKEDGSELSRSRHRHVLECGILDENINFVDIIFQLMHCF